MTTFFAWAAWLFAAVFVGILMAFMLFGVLLCLCAIFINEPDDEGEG